MNPKNARPNWRPIRVRKEIHARLKELGSYFQGLYALRGSRFGDPDGDGPSMNDIIEELIRRDDAHRERGRRQGKKAARRGPETLEATQEPPKEVESER